MKGTKAQRHKGRCNSPHPSDNLDQWIVVHLALAAGDLIIIVGCPSARDERFPSFNCSQCTRSNVRQVRVKYAVKSQHLARHPTFIS
jgi:hypothetical protein